MGQSDKIFVDYEKFEKAINDLKGYKMSLIDARSNLITQTDSLSENWREKSGKSFGLCANLIESNFKDLIEKLNDEIKELEDFQEKIKYVDEAKTSQDKEIN